MGNNVYFFGFQHRTKNLKFIFINIWFLLSKLENFFIFFLKIYYYCFQIFLIIEIIN